MTLTAPAGYGKTTLLAQWSARDRRPFAWVSLDERDNDPIVLLRHLAASVHAIEPLDASTPLSLTAAEYSRQRESCAATWKEILSRGMNVETPEPYVNDAWRHLICQNFELINGDRVHYSAGNQYDRLYEAEGSDAALAMMVWGYESDMRRWMVPLFDFTRKGLEFHQAGFKLLNLCRYYWQTRDATAVKALRPLWEKEAQRLVDNRTGEHGLFPREQYCGDIHTPVQSINVNSKAWRAIRDLSAVLAEVGEVDILVANAAHPATGLLTDLDQERIDRMLEVNLRAPIALARDIVKYAENWWDKRSGAADFLDPAFGTGAFYSALRQVFPSEAVCRAEAAQVRAIARLAQIRGHSRWVADEVAMELCLSRNAADHLVDVCVAVTTRLPNVLATMDAGEVNLLTARKICEVTAPLPLRMLACYFHYRRQLLRAIRRRGC